MTKSNIAVVVLAIALVASNVYWLYQLIDLGVSYSYLDDSCRHAQVTADQALKLLPEAAKLEATEDSIIASLKAANPGIEPFEKEGYIWIGRIGLRFDENGRLADAQPN